MTSPMNNMIAMSRGPQVGWRSLGEDSPLEAPVGGNNRHMSLMSPATRELVLKSRTMEIEKFAESRQLNAGAIIGIAEAAMRLGRVPDLRQYGFSGDDAKAIKQFVAGDVLNIAIEDVQAMDTINEALDDREIESRVKRLTQSGAANLLTKIESGDKSLAKFKARGGFVEALTTLKAGDLKATKALLGEGATMSGACGAIVMAMGAADSKVKEIVDSEVAAQAALTAGMQLNNSLSMYAPSPVLNALRLTRQEDDKNAEEKALGIEPRLGFNPLAKQAPTLQDMADMAKQAIEQKVDEGWGHMSRQAMSKKMSSDEKKTVVKKLDAKQSRALDRGISPRKDKKSPFEDENKKPPTGAALLRESREPSTGAARLRGTAEPVTEQKSPKKTKSK